MIKMNLNKILFILIFLFILVGCIKDEPITIPPTYYLPDNFKNWIYFKTGTYWIYKNDTTGIEDSIVVNESYNDIESMIGINQYNESKIMYYYEDITMVSYSYTENIKYHESAFIYINDPHAIGISCTFAKWDITFGWPAYNNTLEFIYEPVLNSKLGRTSVSAIFDTLIVAGKLYFNVIQINDTLNTLDGGYPTYYYFAKNYGLIKKEIMETSEVVEWNLIRYNIVQ